jgi:hypothetical protein
VYISGSARFVSKLREALLQSGVPAAQLASAVI